MLFTGKHAQFVVMSLKPGEAAFVFNGKRRKVRNADAVVVPAGTHHNVVDSSKTETLKLSTIYSPPNHPAGTVH